MGGVADLLRVISRGVAVFGTARPQGKTFIRFSIVPSRCRKQASVSGNSITESRWPQTSLRRFGLSIPQWVAPQQSPRPLPQTPAPCHNPMPVPTLAASWPNIAGGSETGDDSTRQMIGFSRHGSHQSGWNGIDLAVVAPPDFEQQQSPRRHR